ncbi:MAG TPA: nodulation protein NodJ [Chromatiales bacterium]|nr:nodulation protein NodJ [Chromatiales bacterium]
MHPWGPPRIRLAALAVWRRNLLVWRKLLGPALAMNFGEPVLYLLGLGYGLGFFIGEMAGMPYLSFLASGIVASSAMTTASFEGMYSVFTRMVPQRTYEAILATPLDADDIVTGELLWCATKSLISATAILVVAVAMGALPATPGLVLVLPVVFLTGLAFAGPALVVSAVAPNYDFFNYYMVLVITPMFILSGVFYPIDTLPTTLQDAVQFLPLTHAVALSRSLVAGTGTAVAWVHVVVLSAYAMVGHYFAAVLIRRRLLR